MKKVLIFLLGACSALMGCKFDKNVCVVVDGFSTGNALVDGIRAYGYSCIHIQSDKDLEKVYGKRDLSKYLENISYNGSVEEILEQLAPYHVKFVIPGAEPGVLLADQLANALKVYPNDIEKSLARRNKFDMTLAVKNEGLRVVDSYKSGDADELLKWAVDYPIVIKPLDSAGGDNVHFCHSADEVKAAFYKVKGALNVFGAPNVEVLAQTYATGEEYMINAVLHEGVMMITDIWRVSKQGAVYDYFVNIDSRDGEYAALESYAKGVCRALGIEYGAIHLEVKYDPANGPVFIECGARMMGSTELAFQTSIHGYNQLTILLESYFNPDYFKRRAATPQTDAKHGMSVNFISTKEGKIEIKKDVASYFKEIPCFHDLYFKYNTVDFLQKTIDLATCPGDIQLVGDDREEVGKSYARIREAEQRLYDELIQRAL